MTNFELPVHKNRWGDKASSCSHNATGFMKKFAAIAEKIDLKDEEVENQWIFSLKRQFFNRKSMHFGGKPDYIRLGCPI